MWMPFLNAGNKLGVIQFNDIMLLVLDDARFVVINLAVMGFVLIESGREVLASLINVHFTQRTTTHFGV